MEEGIKPALALLAGILGELVDGDGEKDRIRLISVSIVGQCLYFVYGRPVIRRLFRRRGLACSQGIDSGSHCPFFALCNQRGARRGKGRAAIKTHDVIPSRLHSPLFVVSSSLSLTYEGVRPRRFLVAASMAKRVRLGTIWGLTIAIILLVNAPGPSLAADAGGGFGGRRASRGPGPDVSSSRGRGATPGLHHRYALKKNPRIRIAGRDVETKPTASMRRRRTGCRGWIWAPVLPGRL